MKKDLIILAITLMLNIGANAQNTDQVRKQEQEQERTGKKEQVRNKEANRSGEQGQVVSTVARETPSGPDHGKIVSDAARSKKEMKKTEKMRRKEMKKREQEMKKQQNMKQGEQEATGINSPARPGGKPAIKGPGPKSPGGPKNQK